MANRQTLTRTQPGSHKTNISQGAHRGEAWEICYDWIPAPDLAFAMTWSQLSIGAGIPPTTRNAAFRKFVAIIPENL